MARRGKGKRKKGRNRQSGGGGRGGGRERSQSLVIIAPSAPSAPRAPGRLRRGVSMARTRVGVAVRRTGKALSRAGAVSYAAVSGDIGVQVGCEIAEGLGALVKGALDMVADSTETTADDTAFPIVEKFLGSGARVLADMRLAKKHPGLAKITSAFGSSLSGTVYLDWLRKFGAKATVRNAERLQKADT